MKILKVHGREILDSRGNPTVEVDVVTADGVFRGMTPSGASAGQHEALELRDGDKKRFLGKGVIKAVAHVNGAISKKITGMDCICQKEIDTALLALDGTENKDRLGANALLPVSMAVANAGAAAAGKPLYRYISSLHRTKASLPLPMCNVINGGKHAGQENSIQEHMLMPTGAKTFSEGLRMVAESYHALHSLLKKKHGVSAGLIGDEGGFAPTAITTVEERFDLMLQAVEQAGHAGRVSLAMDAASSEFFYKNHYKIGAKRMSGGDLIDFYASLAKKYPLASIEDGLAEDDWEHWAEMTKKLGKNMQIVGDDLFVTNTKRITKGIQLNSANAVLIKLNQIGTVTETLDAIQMTQRQGWNAIVSHRSGETEDSFIADLAVGTDAGQIKTGAPARSDRNAKYNQLLRIEDELGAKATFSAKVHL